MNHLILQQQQNNNMFSYILNIIQKLNTTHKLKDNSLIKAQKGNIAFIGGGNYASSVLIPAFLNANANLIALVTSGGMSAVHHGKKNGFLGSIKLGEMD